MTQILTKKLEKIKKYKTQERINLEKEIDHVIIQIQISPIYSERVLHLYNMARASKNFSNVLKKHLLSVCFYRVILENKLYVSLVSIKKALEITSNSFLSIHLRLYKKLCEVLDLESINFTLKDHITNICDKMGLGEVIKKKAFNLADMIRKKYILPGEYRTSAITSIYFASNFEGEHISINQLTTFFGLISSSILYKKIKIFEKYMKEYLKRKSPKKELNNREKYFLERFDMKHRNEFFRKFKHIKN